MSKVGGGQIIGRMVNSSADGDVEDWRWGSTKRRKGKGKKGELGAGGSASELRGRIIKGWSAEIGKPDRAVAVVRKERGVGG